MPERTSYVDGEVFPRIDAMWDSAAVSAASAATGDQYPGHHDPEFARAQGVSDIYGSVAMIQGIADRAVATWTAGRARITERELRMRAPLVANVRVAIDGAVTAVEDEDHLTVSVEIIAGHLVASVVYTLELAPDRPGHP